MEATSGSKVARNSIHPDLIEALDFVHPRIQRECSCFVKTDADPRHPTHPWRHMKPNPESWVQNGEVYMEKRQPFQVWRDSVETQAAAMDVRLRQLLLKHPHPVLAQFTEDEEEMGEQQKIRSEDSRKGERCDQNGKKE